MSDCIRFISSHQSFTLLTSTILFHGQHLLAFPRLVFALRPPAVASFPLFLFFSTGNIIISKSFNFITEFLFCLLALLEIVQYFKVIMCGGKKALKNQYMVCKTLDKQNSRTFQAQKKKINKKMETPFRTLSLLMFATSVCI